MVLKPALLNSELDVSEEMLVFGTTCSYYMNIQYIFTCFLDLFFHLLAACCSNTNIQQTKQREP